MNNISARAQAHITHLRNKPTRSEQQANLALADHVAHSNYEAWREIATHLLSQAVLEVRAIPWSDDCNDNTTIVR